MIWNLPNIWSKTCQARIQPSIEKIALAFKTVIYLHIDDEQRPRAPQLDDIKTVFHPSSGRSSRIQSFTEAGKERAVACLPIPNEQPWLPFISRIDFEFAALAVRSRLTAELINDWLAFLQRTANESKHPSFRSHTDLYEVLDMASSLLTPVRTDY